MQELYAMLRHKFGTYWNQTETYEALKIYIQMDMDGLQDAVVRIRKNCFYSTFGHKLSDGNIRILFAGEQLTLGTKRLFQIFCQGVANRIHAHHLCNLISIHFRVRFKSQITEP